MSTYTYKKSDASGVRPNGLPDKMVVFQECLQQFNASPVNARKCRLLLAELLRLIYYGENFPAAESTTLFFSISKLFQHKDVSLRQIVYLAIKELSRTSQDILMVTSSIMKDIQAGDIVYKPNAIRTLSKVLDSSTVSASERLFKNAIVEKNPIVSSAALISSYSLLPIAKDVVKRFTNETLETLTSYKQFPPSQFQLHEFYGNSTSNLPSTSYMYQYHALGLLYHLRNHDKMALMKLITSLSEGSSLKNSLSIIQLIRFINKILSDDESLVKVLNPILFGFLKHKSDMVELESSKVLIAFSHLISDDESMAVITCLQKLMTVPRTSTRFAAIRLINKISMKHPEKIMVVSLELENLINDSNRSIQTLAITTLLKTMGVGTTASSNVAEGGESVDRLISKMTSLMDEITEDFKIVIIEAIENLALKFPSKHKKLVTFLTDLLREDGTLALKGSIVDALFDLIKFLPDDSGSKQLILMNLCEFIEDCEFTELSVRILHLLGDEGPKTTNPSYYIRHIYNRLVLENSIIRSSAIISLSKFAIICGGSLCKNIEILLKRCLSDADDEVRDRAVLALGFINNSKKELIIKEEKYNLNVMENKLTHYLSAGDFSHKFDIEEVPVLTAEELKSYEYGRKMKNLEEPVDKLDDNKPQSAATDENGARDASSKDASHQLKLQQYSAELAAIPEFADFGKLSTSSPLVHLTDKENEFVVTCVKHFFISSSKLVLQYNIVNTVDHMILQDISVVTQADNESYEEDFTIQLDELRPQQSGTVYVAYSIPDVTSQESGILSGFGNTLNYIHKEIIDDEGNIDPTDEGWADDYQIEDLLVVPGDFITPVYNSNFTAVFDGLPFEESSIYNLSSSCKSIEIAVEKLVANVNMMPLDGSDYVSADATSHSLKLLGKDIWGGKVALLVRIASTSGKLIAKAQAKGETEAFVSQVLDGII
ncbi:Coatomer subunit gamma [[Candida] zeylanoides]